MPKFINLIGRKFGKLTVIGLAPKGPRAWWNCKCDCGNIAIVSSAALRSDHTKSCGCYVVEAIVKRQTKHGHAPGKGRNPSPEYMAWRDMKRRCKDVKCNNYNGYGERGISYCDRWENFVNFLEDMGLRPPETEIDRIDNNGNYCKENCRWVDKTTNMRNTRINVFVEFDGQRKCISEWSCVTGIPWHTLYYRIILAGWPVNEALTFPVGVGRWERTIKSPSAKTTKGSNSSCQPISYIG